MAWVVPLYPRDHVNRAGRLLVAPALSLEDHIAQEDAVLVVDNWRASHSFPLNTFQNTLRNKTHEIDKTAIIAQRLKRIPAIAAKLKRFPSINLSAMQDIGGCRAIVRAPVRAYAICKLYKESDLRHKLVREKDYIENPKSSGYRGIHLVYAYVSDKNKVYNDLRIEVQLRSRLQHAWATAVETVGTFLHQALKSSEGEDDWLRFFALMGSALALRERRPMVPGTPTASEDLVKELRGLSTHLDVENRLSRYGSALLIPEDPRAKGSHYFLLELQPQGTSLQVRPFGRQDLESAQSAYLEAERKIRDKRTGQAVLVSVDSLKLLRRAYPNYYLDTREFLNAMNRAIL